MNLFSNLQNVDKVFLMTVVALASVGLVMMGSASIDFSAQKYGNPMFHIYRQSIFMVIAICAAIVAFSISTKDWYKMGGICLLAAFVLLVAVLIPGIGREVNRSVRESLFRRRQ